MQAVTSSGSAEQIAVSSLMTYDLYGTYINPRASAKQLIAVSRTVVVLYGLVMGRRRTHDHVFLWHSSAVSSEHCNMAKFRNNTSHGDDRQLHCWQKHECVPNLNVRKSEGLLHRCLVMHLQRGWH